MASNGASPPLTPQSQLQPQPQPNGNDSSSPITGVPSPQFAILDYLFPGFSIFSSAANAYFDTDINSFLPLLLALLAVFLAWNHARSSISGLIDEYLFSSVRIRADDEVYSMVMMWLSKQGFARRSRHIVANADLSHRNRRYSPYDSDDSDDEGGGGGGPDDDDDDADDGFGGRKKKPLHYTPAFGSHFFWYKRCPLFFERRKDREQLNLMVTNEREEISLWCFGRSPRILKELLLDARRLHMAKDEGKTLIYRGNLTETYWQRCMSRLNRPFSTVVLNERVKQELLRDAAEYLDTSTRRWYANRGIPYRHGLLLYGPPGTGKSSLSLALAGHFRMKIYMVSLSSAAATEENITNLFHELPTRCIVLLEDVDTAGLTHTREDASPPPSDSVASPTPQLPSGSPLSTAPGAAAAVVASSGGASSGGRLSLSGLLNVLDGVASQEGRILIMTTNHVEKLDKALIRPGRVDMMVPFALADAEISAAIFRAIYAPYDNETVPSRRAKTVDTMAASKTGNNGGTGLSTGSSSPVLSDDSEAEAERAAIRARVEGQAKRFAASVPEGEFSPAELQGLLLRHKRAPEAAIAAVDEWVAKVRRDRREQAGQKLEADEKPETDASPAPLKAGSSSSSSSDSASDSSSSSSESEAGGRDRVRARPRAAGRARARRH